MESFGEKNGRFSRNPLIGEQLGAEISTRTGGWKPIVILE
jgi:hypothetical protein